MSAYRTPGEPGATIVDSAGNVSEPRHRCAEPEYVAGGRLVRKQPCPLPWNWFWRFSDGDKFLCDCGRKYLWVQYVGWRERDK